MTKQKYGELLRQELIIMEDHGFYLPFRAFQEVTGNAPENEDFLTAIKNDSAPFEYKGKTGSKWKEFFWIGELEPNSYLEVVVED